MYDFTNITHSLTKNKLVKLSVLQCLQLCLKYFIMSTFLKIII